MMQNFKIYIGVSTSIVKEGLESYGTFGSTNKGNTPIHESLDCGWLADGEVNENNEIEYLFVGMQTDATHILQEVKDDERFHAEHHFKVQHKGKVIQEFDGMILDALLYIANDGEAHV